MRGQRHALFASLPVVAPSLSISCSLQPGAATTYNVAGATGNLYTQLGVVESVIVTGGTLPYTTSTDTFTSDGGSGTVTRILSGDGVHNTIQWSGLSIGQTALFHLSLHVIDSTVPTPQNQTSRFPSAGSVAITRTS